MQLHIGIQSCKLYAHVSAIRLKFQGIAKTKWTVNRRKRRTSFWAEEIYFNEEYTLVESKFYQSVTLYFYLQLV